MTDSQATIVVESEINRFHEMFKDNPFKHISEGTWFTKILQMILTEHAQKINSEYFKKKYIGLNNEHIANQLIKTASDYTAIAGALAAGVITAAELSITKKTKESLIVGATAIIGELAYISYLQLKLIYEISVVLGADLDKEDPEDLLTIFWFSLGIKTWQSVSKVALNTTTRSTAYLGRKALRLGIRKSLVNLAVNFGGVKLAKKLTEKAILSLLVPGANILIGGFINRKFTQKLGNNAVEYFKTRGITRRIIDKLFSFGRYYQIITIPLIFHIGIFDVDKKHVSRNVEMQNNIVRKLHVQNEEEKIIKDLVELDFDEFCHVLSNIDEVQIQQYLFEIAVCSHLMCKNANKDNFDKVAQVLKIDLDKVDIEKYKKKLV